MVEAAGSHVSCMQRQGQHHGAQCMGEEEVDMEGVRRQVQQWEEAEMMDAEQRGQAAEAVAGAEVAEDQMGEAV